MGWSEISKQNSRSAKKEKIERITLELLKFKTATGVTHCSTVKMAHSTYTIQHHSSLLQCSQLSTTQVISKQTHNSLH